MGVSNINFSVPRMKFSTFLLLLFYCANIFSNPLCNHKTQKKSGWRFRSVNNEKKVRSFRKCYRIQMTTPLYTRSSFSLKTEDHHSVGVSTIVTVPHTPYLIAATATLGSSSRSTDMNYCCCCCLQC